MLATSSVRPASLFCRPCGARQAGAASLLRATRPCARRARSSHQDAGVVVRAQQFQTSGGSYKSPAQLDDTAKGKLAVGTALRNIGWISFWSQLVLSIVSAVVLLFSTGVTAQGALNLSFIDASTLVGVGTSLVSTFLAWSYIRAGRKLAAFEEVRLRGIEAIVLANNSLNLIGMGATILGLQATIGNLVAKTLTTATTAYAVRPPGSTPAALDVFSVQASANTVMAHYCGFLFSSWILRVVVKQLRREEELVYAAAAPQAPSAPPMPGYLGPDAY